jgi:hypothetical protein
VRSWWFATLALLGVGRHPRITQLRAYKKGQRPMRSEPPSLPPGWEGPPEDEIGVGVGARMVIASQPRLVIALTDCVAYSTGFAVGIAVRSRDDIRPQQMGFLMEHATDGGAAIQIGMRFSDGREARTTGLSPGQESQDPTGPIISPLGGGGGGRSWSFSYFVCPLPPEGPITLTCKWPARGLQTAAKELNGTAIRVAGLKSRSVWG